MKPAPFAYAKARSVAHAIELLASDDARLLAGGQSLIATLNMRLSHPALLVDINGVGGLDRIESNNGHIEIGAIAKGAQNLPGNWESSRFNLPLSLHKAIPKIGEHETAVLLHNDAVVQGLSETPFMSDVKHWGALTIGTGLGNARFTNRASAGKD